MKRHLHLAIGLSSVLLAACCLAGAGLAWLRAAVGAVARTALLCTASEPAQPPTESLTMATSLTSESALPGAGYWFGPTVGVDRTLAGREPDPVPAFDAAAWNPGPPGTARAGPVPVPMTGTGT